MTLFLLGTLVSIPASMLATYLYNYLNRRSAYRNSTRARKRLAELRAELARMQRYQEDRPTLTHFLLARLILLNVFWVFVEAIGSLLSATVDGTYTAYTMVDGIPIPVDMIANVVNTSNGIIGVVLLYITAQIGVRALRVWRRIESFESYEAQVLAELAQLELVAAKPGNPTAQPDAVAETA